MGLRIIAGEHRGRVIVTPKGWNTRPTQGRIRESIFNIIRNEIPGASVLDLFAGSGAFGLEALSRGAGMAVFVDRAREARDAIDKNIRALHLMDRARLLHCGYAEALGRLQSENQQFDILFLDPPYQKAGADALFSDIFKSGVAGPGALWIYEHARDSVFSPGGLRVVDQRAYGQTRVTFMMASEA